MSPKKRICNKYGHDFKESTEYHDKTVFTCTECGIKDIIHPLDKKGQLESIKRSIIQPYQRKAWYDIHKYSNTQSVCVY